MARVWFAAVLLCAALLAPVGTGAGAAPPDADIVATVPNPVADGDAGEFVVLDVPVASTANWTLGDGERVVSLPDDRPTTRIAVSDDPAATRRLADAPVLAVASLSLANGGERLRLRRDGTSSRR